MAESNNNNSFKHDVFISYSSMNKNVADAIVSDFEQHGIKCWYAPRDILPGEEWVTAIKNGLDNAKVLVLLYTDESNDSRQVMNEVALAFNEGKTIVPFRLTDSGMNNELEYYLTRVHWLDAVSKPLNKNIEELREYLEVILQHAPAVQNKPDVEKTSAKTNVSNGNNKLPIIIAAAAAVVVVAVIAIVLLTGKKTDKVELADSGVNTQVDESLLSFGSEYKKEDICSITFMDSVPENAQTDGFLIFDGSTDPVYAIFTPNGNKYDLIIASNSRVVAPADCSELFAGYTNMESIDINDYFDTINVTSMNRMFDNCSSLRKLDISCFDFSNVTKAEFMFSGCTDMKVSVDDKQPAWAGFLDLKDVCTGSSNVSFRSGK